MSMDQRCSQFQAPFTTGDKCWCCYLVGFVVSICIVPVGSGLYDHPNCPTGGRVIYCVLRYGIFGGSGV